MFDKFYVLHEIKRQMRLGVWCLWYSQGGHRPASKRYASIFTVGPLPNDFASTKVSWSFLNVSIIIIPQRATITVLLIPIKKPIYIY